MDSSGEVQEAGGGLLPRGTGARSPESLRRGEHEARTMRALREGRASGNARCLCLAAQSGAHALGTFSSVS